MTQQVAADEALQRRAPAGPLLVAAAVAGLTLALRLHDPHGYGSWGLCPFKALTGLDCPGCGGLRAVNDLTHGDLSAAAGSNLFFVASIPLLVGLWGVWLWRWRQEARRREETPLRLLTPARARLLGSIYLGALLAFTVFRNTPWGHALKS
jgi:hypothetical protein